MLLFGEDRRVEDAVLECFASTAGKVTAEAVARRAGRSRATLFRQFENFQGVLLHAHRRVLERTDRLVPRAGKDRRHEFEVWWSQWLEWLRSPSGLAFQRVRSQLIGTLGIHAVQQHEVSLLKHMKAWVLCRPTDEVPQHDAVTYAVWIILLATAGVPEGNSIFEVTMSSLAWSTVAGEVDPEELDVELALAMEPLGLRLAMGDFGPEPPSPREPTASARDDTSQLAEVDLSDA